MENTTPNPTRIATKWAIIYVITSIVITYAFQLLNVDQNSAVKYLAYIPFIAFLLLAQKELKDQLGGFITFGEGFSTGFRYAVFGGLLFAIFLYLYLAFLSPQVLEQSMIDQKAKMVERGMSQEQIDRATEIGIKYGPIIGAFVAAIGITIFGAIIALIGAAIFKRERTPSDIEQGPTVDPVV